MLRPCVARIMSLSRGWRTISYIGTVGRPERMRVHVPPRSIETNSPNSVPTYSTPASSDLRSPCVTTWPAGDAVADRSEVVAAVNARVDVGAVVVVARGRRTPRRRCRRRAPTAPAGRHRRPSAARELRGEVGPVLAAVPRHVTRRRRRRRRARRPPSATRRSARGCRTTARRRSARCVISLPTTPMIGSVSRFDALRQVAADRRPASGRDRWTGTPCSAPTYSVDDRAARAQRRVPVPAVARAPRAPAAAGWSSARWSADRRGRCCRSATRCRRRSGSLGSAMRHEPVAALDAEPFVVDDAETAARRARAAPRVVVLHAAVHAVRRLHVVADVVELAEIHVVDAVPTSCPLSQQMPTPPSLPSMR